MVALYHSVTNNTVSFEPAARQVQFRNHSFKIDSDGFDIKPRINNSELFSPAVRLIHLHCAWDQSFSVSDFFKGPLLLDDRYFRGDRYLGR